MRLLKQFGTVVVAAAIASLAVGAVEQSWLLTLVVGVAAAVLVLLAYRWIVRRTEHRAVVEVSRAGALSGVARGSLTGMLMFVVVIACLTAVGAYRVEGWGSVTTAAGFAGVTAVAVISEELIFRGVLFRVFEDRAGTWISLVATGLLFGAMHLVNPDASAWGALAIAVEAGFMLAAAYAATRTLWLPIGIHFGWNFAAAGIFGTEVSGSGAPQGILAGTTSGPVVVSGGAFGPEGSVFAVLAGVLLTTVLMVVAHRRGRVVPRRRAVTPAPAVVTL
jgi:membrane protease YdiL (CAAX protease family)